jgi:hypothetical protein
MVAFATLLTSLLNGSVLLLFERMLIDSLLQVEIANARKTRQSHVLADSVKARRGVINHR